MRDITLSEARELATEPSYVLDTDVLRLAVLVTTVDGETTLQHVSELAATGEYAISEYLAAVGEPDADDGCEAVRIVAG